MTDRKTIALAAAALIAAGGIGFTAARFAGAGQEQAAEEHHEEGEAGVVKLNPGEAADAGVDVVLPEQGATTEVLLAGRVAFAPNAQSSVGAPLAGNVVAVHVAAGSRVRVGAPIATLRSADGAAARASLDASSASADAAGLMAARERRLMDAGVSARQDWEAARATALKAQADLRAARAQSAALGSPGSNGLVVVRSPIAGIVSSIVVAPGAVLAQGGEVAEVANPDRVELVFDVPAANIGLVRIGAPIRGEVPGGAIDGVVTAVAPGTGGAGGTVRARILGAPPPAGTVLSARLAAQGGGGLSVPSEAVQTIDGVPSVFVAGPAGFTARPVIPGNASAGRTEITRGLRSGERVAGKGAFLLKAELSKGEGGHED